MKDIVPDIVVKQVSFSYGTNYCLENISLHLNPHHFYGLLGPNGSGKSTLLDLISGFLQPDTGQVLLGGTPIALYAKKELARTLTAVPQSFSLDFDYSVEDTVLMGRYPHIHRFRTPQSVDYEKADEAMKLLNIYQLRKRKVTKLSGGEKQRVMLARAFAQDTSLIILDEVTSNLDINHAISIMRTLKNLVCKNGKTIIAALHDINMAAFFCDELIVLQNGKLHDFDTCTNIISEEMLRELYQVNARVSEEGNGKKHIRFDYV